MVTLQHQTTVAVCSLCDGHSSDAILCEWSSASVFADARVSVLVSVQDVCRMLCQRRTVNRALVNQAQSIRTLILQFPLTEILNKRFIQSRFHTELTNHTNSARVCTRITHKNKYVTSPHAHPLACSAVHVRHQFSPAKQHTLWISEEFTFNFLTVTPYCS